MSKKPIPRGARARKPERRCYELTGTAMSYPENERLILIHGIRDWGGYALPHAWLLDPSDNTVFDPQDQKWYPAAEHPGIERRRYTQREQADQIHATGHFGPWD